jgi:hypothetical protein
VNSKISLYNIESYIMSSNCEICLENFNKSTRKEVNCLDCNNSCCRACHQIYILSKDVIDCMFCNKPQTYEHIKNSHYDSFIKSKGSWKGKGYREHLEEVYYKNEMAMFPETQIKIERDQFTNKIYQENKYYITYIKKLTNDIKSAKSERFLKCSCKRGPIKCICVTETEKNKWLDNKESNLNLIKDLEKKIENNFEILRHPKNTTKKKKVIEKCMANDCDGFLNTEWKCNKCDKITCNRCREIKNDNHICNEDTVKTIQLAIKTSKPCPKCNERIHRIYGCDQVYCPLCKIVFSYSTGIMQIGGLIHQPDAVNELRKNGKLHRDIRDIPCGGVEYIWDSISRPIPDYNGKKNLWDSVRFPVSKYRGLKNIVLAFLRWCIGYEDYQNDVQIRDNDVFNINSTERYNFLSGNISKEVFKKKIYVNYKNYEKENEERVLKAGFYICLADILRSLEGVEDYNKIYELISQIFELSKNYNIEFDRVNKLYNGTPHQKYHIYMDIINPIRTVNSLPRLYFGLCKFGNLYNPEINLQIENFLEFQNNL